jgi:transformation/transcription domain-associated protein
MVPARLNFLLPHIGLLMKPLVFALNGSTETAILALKKLETWVENLQPGYFDPLLQVKTGVDCCLLTKPG